MLPVVIAPDGGMNFRLYTEWIKNRSYAQLTSWPAAALGATVSLFDSTEAWPEEPFVENAAWLWIKIFTGKFAGQFRPKNLIQSISVIRNMRLLFY